MALDPNLFAGLSTVAGAIVSWVVKHFKDKQNEGERVQKELRDLGLDLIEELRQEVAIGRNERTKLLKENEQLREQSWRWRGEHTELAVENEGLRAQLENMNQRYEDMTQRCARLSRDVDRYQLELSKTADIRPPKEPETDPSRDPTGPQRPIRR